MNLIEDLNKFAALSDLKKIKSILMNENIGYRPKGNEI